MGGSILVASIRKCAVTTAIGLVIAGCNPPLGAPDVPDDVAVPTTIGVITQIEQRNDGILATLEDGSSVLLPTGARDLTGAAEVGRLLMVGEGGPVGSAEGTWYAAVRTYSSGCFYIDANGEVRDDRLALSEGFSLPLSANWNETETTFVKSPPVGFCLDHSGAVVRPNS